jgi:ABC-type lipoprotein release transport system permease subunit
MLFKIAWRNIWRNPRRTLVIITAVIIGVWTMLVSSALMRGIADGMVKNGIKTLTGHIQIHRTGYRNDPVIENSITDLEAVKSALDKHLASDDLWTMRVKVNAIASNARHSGAVMMVGIDPLKEAKISFIGNSVTKEVISKVINL